MKRPTAPRLKIERLIDHLFDGIPRDPLADEVRGWLADSTRFRAFADAHRDKIRKKLRTARDDGARLDVRAELHVARALLSEPRIELTFEAYGSGRRGPDFTVLVRGAPPFNLEVTRPRHASDAPHTAGPLLAKLRQMPPSAPNAVLIAIEGATAAAFDVAATARALRARADAKDDAFFIGRGLEGTKEFYRQFLRLGAAFVWCEDAVGDDRATLWTNRSARIPLPERAARACLSCLRAAIDGDHGA